jgi:hypothetical protein
MARLTLLLSVCLAIAAGVATAAPPLPPGYHDCGKISGPTVREPWRTSGGVKLLSMHHYGIGRTDGTSCSFARAWVARIVHETTRDGLLPHPKGPARWRCLAGQVVKKVAASGLCHDAANKTGFSWGVEP